MTTLEAIGQRIAATRRQAGLTQHELADAVGVSRSLLAGMETGSERGELPSLIALADYFKVPLDWLLCRTVPPGGPLLGQFVDDPDELAWLRFLRTLSQEDRLAAARLLRLPPERDRKDGTN